MSIPYLDPALPEMVKTTEEKLRQERANLWRAKNLNRQLLGDEAWMPCSVVESPDDWDLFEPSLAPAEGPATKRRKLNGNSDHAEEPNDSDVHENPPSTNGVESTTDDIELPNGGPVMEDATPAVDQEAKEEDSGTQPSTEYEPAATSALVEDGDIPMTDAEAQPETNGDYISEDSDRVAAQLKESQSPPAAAPSAEGEEAQQDQNSPAEHPSQEASEADADSPAAPPPRRITRALALTNAPTPPLSPTLTLTPSTTSSLLQVSPLFLLPSPAHTHHPSPSEHETRKLLTAYIQKQEECVRGYEMVLAKLVMALKMRDDVLEMCKAEGHVAEMSDGEDWVDTERWGLGAGELRKGKYEEEDMVEDNVAAIGGGRKGRRRRQN